MIHPRIYRLLESITADAPPFRPTLLYNEGWLLRLILDWFSSHPTFNHPLAFAEGARWFSEALLPSAFLARCRSDPLAESHTHADGVIGHFSIGDAGKADFSLSPQATQFVALEAKILSGLSLGTQKSKSFDQAARSVACMAEVLRRAKRPPDEIEQLGFYVLAPKRQIEQALFEVPMEREGILQKVERRVQAYAGTKDAWFDNWFVPTHEKIILSVLSWETVIADIKKHDSTSGQALAEFYCRCLKFN